MVEMIKTEHLNEWLCQLVELRDLVGELRASEKSKFEDARHAQHRIPPEEELMRMMSENLDRLRLGVKYLVFDLEATKRENVYLRGVLAEINPQEGGQGEEPEEE